MIIVRDIWINIEMEKNELNLKVSLKNKNEKMRENKKEKIREQIEKIIREQIKKKRVAK